MALTSIPAQKVYPILKPGDWIGIRNGAFQQTMVGSSEEPQVIIAFGYNVSGNLVFLLQHEVGAGQGEDLLQTAFSNLEACSLNFERSSSLNGRLLTCSGSEYCSEKILSPTFMQKAHQQLQAERILVSIARRRGMMIIGQDANSDLLNTFMYLHEHTWRDDSRGNPRITDMLFIMEKGEIIGSYHK